MNYTNFRFSTRTNQSNNGAQISQPSISLKEKSKALKNFLVSYVYVHLKLYPQYLLLSGATQLTGPFPILLPYSIQREEGKVLQRHTHTHFIYSPVTNSLRTKQKIENAWPFCRNGNQGLRHLHGYQCFTHHLGPHRGR